MVDSQVVTIAWGVFVGLVAFTAIVGSLYGSFVFAIQAMPEEEFLYTTGMAILGWLLLP